MKKLFSLYVCVLLICWQVVSAADYEIYVYNHIFTGTPVTRSGKTYVNAHAIATALGLDFQEKDDAVIIGKPPSGKVNAGVFLNGQPFSDFFHSNGAWFVALKSFAEASGNRFVINKDTKIIDILTGKTETLSQKQAEALVGKSVDSSHTNNNFSTYENEKYGIRISYPQIWEKRPGTGDEIVSFRRPPENSSDLHRENLNISIESLVGNPTLQEYIAGSIAHVKAEFPFLEIQESADSVLSGLPGHKMIYSGKIRGTVSLTVLQIFTLKDRKAYVITYAGPGSTYERSLQIANQMINSFQIKQ